MFAPGPVVGPVASLPFLFLSERAAVELPEAAVKRVAEDAGTLIQQPIVATWPGDFPWFFMGLIKNLMGFYIIYKCLDV